LEEGQLESLAVRSYAPKGAVIPPPDLGVARQVQIRFVDPNTFITSDSVTYHRQL
jgi:hypothetical protein